VMPQEFVHVLEEIGLIVRVGAWIIATACRQLGAWQAAALGPVQMSVNVSRRQFIEGDLEGSIVAALAEHRVPPDLLDLELTEGSLMVNTDRTIGMLRNLKKLGVQVSIDDFGTGYSSLAYLRRFPIDTLKIDIAFIREVTTNPDDAAITRAIIGMAHHLRLHVVAEGVETAAQLAYLRRHRCDQIQGHYFSAACRRPRWTSCCARTAAWALPTERCCARPARPCCWSMKTPRCWRRWQRCCARTATTCCWPHRPRRHSICSPCMRCKW
ncbi:MAG: EAL domain-containing protein, partial [Pseudomonadota bacterium]|nr:EAL domain-containing protein [Pseudomonadota bacterium]